VPAGLGQPLNLSQLEAGGGAKPLEQFLVSGRQPPSSLKYSSLYTGFILRGFPMPPSAQRR
jgi:hypothetical protein